MTSFRVAREARAWLIGRSRVGCNGINSCISLGVRLNGGHDDGCSLNVCSSGNRSRELLAKRAQGDEDSFSRLGFAGICHGAGERGGLGADGRTVVVIPTKMVRLDFWFSLQALTNTQASSTPSRQTASSPELGPLREKKPSTITDRCLWDQKG